MKNSFWVCFVLLIFSSGCVAQSIVESLPGYPGKLPFKLETGYVSVGELDEVQLFYYFIESERNPVKDPLLLWLTGGPGCSGFSGLAFEVGPLLYDYKAFNGSLPSFVDNQYSWTQIANMIFLDAPVGTGFSYSTTQKGWHSSDTLSTKAIYEFLRKWILEHPRFSNNPLYITGDSYSGMIVPMVTYEIAKGNRARKHPMLNLQGYTLGNPVTDLHNDENSRVQYFYRVGLISTELYESVKRSCQGEYISPNIQDPQCFNDIAQIAMCTIKVNDAQILEPKCSFASPKPQGLHWGRKFFDDLPIDIAFASSKREENWCRNSNYVLSYIWANDQSVQLALHVRNGTIIDWKRCNKTLDYDSDILSTVYYHRILMAMGYRALIYSGDHDMMIPYTGTLSWIKTLNLSTIDGWRPWFVEGQIAGFTMKLSEAATIGDGLVFATVKGGGHTAPEYKPKECFQMVDRWLSYYFL
ncbi:serine carboxypeptidase-like 18 isoform X2 [Pistacia vera]|uniref:serine carboxypeptidase-like 18 isoform X2 n=1 Tax=Pistacia vera TaxID=55513 RepID=UPI00126385D8|nr:serine carboxypeptidase-like 18 isoform X2 [Pistacia vera]